MTWLQDLAEMYDILINEDNKGDFAVKELQPIAHCSQTAHLIVFIDDNSEFIRSEWVEKKNQHAFVPCTIDSAARTSGIAPHPLFDNLSYVAKDLSFYCPDNGIKKKRSAEYLRNLKNWVDNDPINLDIAIIYDYLKKGTLIKDLLQDGTLSLSQSQQLMPSAEFNGQNLEKALVLFGIIRDGQVFRLWEDSVFQRKYTEYFLNNLLKNEGLCYISGRYRPLQVKHGKYIRYPGDGAKLISSNDEKGYTFRGRFVDSNEAVGISYEVSEKAHAVLRWLMQNNKAFREKGYSLICFSKDGPLDHPYANTYDSVQNILASTSGIKMQKESLNFGRDATQKLKKLICLRTQNLTIKDKVSIMAVDNASPGRMAILYYEEVNEQDYFDNIYYYHESIGWRHHFKYKDYYISFTGAPSAEELVLYVFGREIEGRFTLGSDKDSNSSSVKWKAQLLRRLLPVIINRKKIPYDFVNRAFNNAITPLGKTKDNWQNCLTIACGIIKKYYNEKRKGRIDMNLQKDLSDTSYLYGRLLAVAEKIERDYNDQQGKEKSTSYALRFMHALAKHPFKTWQQIELHLAIYLRKLKKTGGFYQTKLDEIMSKFDIKEYKSNHPLNGLFLLGYHCQLQAFYEKKQNNEEN